MGFDEWAVYELGEGEHIVNGEGGVDVCLD